jgi:hypothetical protein
MTGLILGNLSCAVVRSNPRYRFVPFEKLSQAEMACLGGNPAVTTFAGVLLDTEVSGLSVKAVSANTAALFNELRTPLDVHTLLTELPSCVRDKIVARLVFDGILEIAVDDTFVSQGAAYALIVQNDEDIVGTSKLANLSVAALKSGQRLSIREPEKLAARLYFYHRLPVTSWWSKLWPDGDAVLQFLGLAPDGSLRQDLFSCFKMAAPRMSSPLGNVQWLSWHRREGRSGHPSDASRYKLYVSPNPQFIRSAFAEVVALLPNFPASGLKIGSNAHGILRPDKLVVYFDRYDDLFTFAETLLPQLAGISAHGVPFSAPIDDAGILSWGTDPPRSERDIGWYVDDSWRIWLCNRLAVALIAAWDSSTTEITPWRYALARLWLSGVDTRTWTLHESSDKSP